MKKFDLQKSAGYCYDENIETVMKVTATKYISDNPPQKFVFRAYSADCFVGSFREGHLIDLDEKYPDASIGAVCWVCGKYWVFEEEECSFSVVCMSPTKIYVNGCEVFESSAMQECRRERAAVSYPACYGRNTVAMRFVKTAAGFGCRFMKSGSIQAAASSHEGMGGFVYSELITDNRNVAFSDEGVPACLEWYPKTKWTDKEKSMTSAKRIFADEAGGTVFAWSSFYLGYGKSVRFSGKSDVRLAVMVDSQTVFEGSGDFGFEVQAGKGRHDVYVRAEHAERRCGYSIECADADLHIPSNVKGAAGKWLYLGAFDGCPSFDELKEYCSMKKVAKCRGGETYWRADMPNTYIRPFLECLSFGKWSYSLGVTLYGLAQTGRFLRDNGFLEYAKQHISMCVDMYKYSVWDEKKFGMAGINNYILNLGSLDDCGSFGSAMLDIMPSDNPDVRYLADIIASYIEKKQERREDGAFYRKKTGEFDENTMWADDLYMSVPFMIRYSKMTGDKKLLDDAANQFLCFFKRLYIPEKSLMSHVFDFKYNRATKVPWGRGNGWVLFSLSELLEALPNTHEKYGELLEMFSTLANGVLKLQGENGLWHQVLTAPDSYEETSCTAMFVYAFSRGVRFGFLKDESFADALIKGARGLMNRSVDKYGNVFGVCRGSLYSFTEDYYKNRLTVRYNDTHGIGIVLLALAEAYRVLNDK